MSLVLWIGLAYLVGAIPSSFLAARVAGVDLRQHGSKNLGATNLYRVLGWKYAVPVGAFDVAKGFVPVFFFAPAPAPLIGFRWRWASAPSWGTCFPCI